MVAVVRMQRQHLALVAAVAKALRVCRYAAPLSERMAALLFSVRCKAAAKGAAVAYNWA